MISVLRQDRHVGKNAHAEPDRDGGLDARQVRTRVGDVPGAAGGFDRVDQPVAIEAPLLGHGERYGIALEIDRMLAAGHPLQPLGPCRDRATVPGIALVESDIEFAELERALLRDAAPAADIEAQGRPRAHEIRQQLRQPVGCKVFRDAKAHNAVGHRSRHHVARLLLERENPPRVKERRRSPSSVSVACLPFRCSNGRPS